MRYTKVKLTNIVCQNTQALTGLGGDLGVGQDLYLDPGLSLQYTQAYSSLRVGSIAVSWREGVGDLGLWSQPELCSWHRTVCRGAGVL